MNEMYLKYPTCPIRNVVYRFGDKWSLLILCSLPTDGKMRYKELMKTISDISRKMLSSTLNRLEKDHLIVHVAYAEIPPRVA